MFYQENMDKAYRFGDVLRGFILSSPNVSNPFLNQEKSEIDYRIDVSLPKFCVILSPCCSIGNGVISLTPLIQLKKNFFKNPYFNEDMTRINREMEPQQTVAPELWSTLGVEEQMKRMAAGKAFALVEHFIYDKYVLFPSYNLGDTETGYYMIDFRTTYNVNCKAISSAKQAPLDAKILQLSVQTRSELRTKISYFYGRIPKEDLIEID